MQPFFDTLRFSDGQGLQKTLPTPSGLSGEGGVRGFETEGGQTRFGWLVLAHLQPCSRSMGAPFFPAGSTPIQRHLITPQPPLSIRPLFPPHILHNAGRSLAVWQSGTGMQFMALPCPAKSAFFIGLLHPLRHIGSQTSIQRRTLDRPWSLPIGGSPRLHNRTPEHEPEERGPPGRTAPAAWRHGGAQHHTRVSTPDSSRKALMI